VLSVSKEERLPEVPKGRKISHHWEEIGGERSGDSGVGAPRGLLREKKNLRKVEKSGLNPDRWIWKGHVEAICMLRRIRTPGNIRRG
jgi:hypothetical protein